MKEVEIDHLNNNENKNLIEIDPILKQELKSLKLKKLEKKTQKGLISKNLLVL